MSATITQKSSAVPGASVVQQSIVALDATYPNPAGYVFTPASFGFTILRRILGFDPATLAAGLFTPVIIPTFNADGTVASFALHLFVATTGAEVANGVSVATSSFLSVMEGN